MLGPLGGVLCTADATKSAGEIESEAMAACLVCATPVTF
jgi:hypothetical protein